MAGLRIVVERDVPAVVALFERVYPEHRWPSRTACESYFREMLFANPWHDLGLPSWLVEQGSRVVGFAGVFPRPMRFHGRQIRVAVGCQFMVDPDWRQSLIGLQLVKGLLAGPQDLFIADGSNDVARRVWQAFGGTVPLLYGLHWMRLLRPARHTLSLVQSARGWGAGACVARPLCAVADAIAGRLRPNQLHRDDPELTEDALDESAMLAHLPAVASGNALVPVYDARTLGWLLDQTARKTRHGTFRARVVRDARRQLVGWYVHFVRAGAVGEVVQLAARDGAVDQVLQRLLCDAWRQGAVAVRGRMDPSHVQEFSDRHCWFRREGAWTLAHSRDAAISAALQRGDAFFSRLEGEWWLRFLGG